MLRFENGLLINESQIIAAELIDNDETVRLTFAVPVSFGKKVEGNPYQVTFSRYEAKALWEILGKGAQQVRSEPPVPSTKSSYAVGGQRIKPKLL